MNDPTNSKYRFLSLTGGDSYLKYITVEKGLDESEHVGYALETLSHEHLEHNFFHINEEDARRYAMAI